MKAKTTRLNALNIATLTCPLFGAIRVLGLLCGIQVIDERSTLDSPNHTT